MHIVLLNQFYWPSVAATAQLSADLCEALVQAGHQVTVICSQGDYVGDAPRLSARAHHNGVDIVRLPATSFGKGNKLLRLTDYASFYGLAAGALLTVKAPDVFICLSTPPMVALAGLYAARLRRAPMIYWCQDVYPDMAVALGVLQADSVAAKALDQASRHLLGRSAAVVSIGERMAEVLSARGASAPVIIHNWSDGSAIDPAKSPPRAENAFRRLLGASPDDVLIMYAGNMGMAHNFTAVDHALNTLAGHPEGSRLCFGFIGEGNRKHEVEAMAARAIEGGARIKFLPYQDREKLPEMLTAADVHLVCMDDQVSGLMVPSKLYGAMAAGRAVLLAGPGEGEAADIVRDTACGFQVRADDGPAMVEALLTLSWDDDLRTQMGQKARADFMARFDRSSACARFVELVEQLR
ncbi:MAG: glycosyltransferase family 4 protein [Bradymonadia bacterium]